MKKVKKGSPIKCEDSSNVNPMEPICVKSHDTRPEIYPIFEADLKPFACKQGHIANNPNAAQSLNTGAASHHRYMHGPEETSNKYFIDKVNYILENWNNEYEDAIDLYKFILKYNNVHKKKDSELEKSISSIVKEKLTFEIVQRVLEAEEESLRAMNIRISLELCRLFREQD